MSALLKKIELVILILIICGLFLPQRVDIQLSVDKWEKLLSVILNPKRIPNASNLDVNQDGSIDIKDLCILYSKFSGGDNDSGKKQIRILEAVVNRDVNAHPYNKQFGKPHYTTSNFSFSLSIQPIVLWIRFDNTREVHYIGHHKIGKRTSRIFALRC